jgi:hypothetical protein
LRHCPIPYASVALEIELEHPKRIVARREYRSACDSFGKSDKQIERCLISTFQVAESMGFKGDFRQWEHLLRIGD